jgi:thiosulfate dehydrogenase [quinone] large subunit
MGGKMIDNPEVQVLGKPLKITIVILRYVMAAQFLWAFFDKLLGLGFSTKFESAWIRGGSPTLGFLTQGATGPFAGLFNAIGGKVLIDVLFMLALLGVGIALLLGIGMKIGTISGSILMLFMWAATLPKTNDFFQIDDHIVYILVLLVLLFAKAGQYAGLGRKWSVIVKKAQWLE